MRRFAIPMMLTFALAMVFIAGTVAAADTTVDTVVDTEADTSADTIAAYNKECGACHGKDGKADTKMGKKLKVRDLTDPEVQKTFTDAEAEKGIAEGVKDDTGKVVMKPKKDKLTPEQITAIVKYVRTFEKK